MTLKRYSAVEMFGIPIDNGANTNDPEEMLAVISAYSIGGRDISREAIDITPYYWKNPTFRYYLSLAHPEGPAVVELLPSQAGSGTSLTANIGGVAVCMDMPEQRRLEIPTDQNAISVIGPSPRFAGQICIHELVAYTD